MDFHKFFFNDFSLFINTMSRDLHLAATAAATAAFAFVAIAVIVEHE